MLQQAEENQFLRDLEQLQPVIEGEIIFYSEKTKGYG